MMFTTSFFLNPSVNELNDRVYSVGSMSLSNQVYYIWYVGELIGLVQERMCLFLADLAYKKNMLLNTNKITV